MNSRRFLVTGGSQGIGAAIVAAARSAGDEVVFTGRNEKLINEVAEATGGLGLKADLSIAADNARTVDTVVKKMGGVDVLVNNAAVGYFENIGELDIDAMRVMFETNVFGMVDLTNRIVPLMKEQGHGDIVNLASTSGLAGHVRGTPYAGSKWAIRGISECWQVELRVHDIRVFCVCPAEVQTDWGGLTGRNDPNKLFAPDVAKAIMSALSSDRRAFWPTITILATNPWKGGKGTPRKSGLF